MGRAPWVSDTPRRTPSKSRNAEEFLQQGPVQAQPYSSEQKTKAPAQIEFHPNCYLVLFLVSYRRCLSNQS